MSANFMLYRKGSAVFRLESRSSGSIRKVTSCVFKDEIMSDDSISVTLKSTARMGFKLRDYIIYNSRPYFINRLPECSIDEKRIFTYKMTFEGVMYDLGRVAYIMPDAYGYDLHGQLHEFGNLIVSNMNRVNRHIEWDYTVNGVTTRYAARMLSSNSSITYWGLNRNVDIQRWTGAFTEWIATSSPNPAAGSFALNQNLSENTDCVIVGVKEWTLGFPKGKTTAPTYPQPGGHCPATEYAVRWPDPDTAADLDYIHEDDYTAIANSHAGTFYDEGSKVYPPGDDEGEYTHRWICTVSNIARSTPLPEPTDVVTSAGDTCVLTNTFTFRVRTIEQRRDYDPATQQLGEWYQVSDTSSVMTDSYNITYVAIGYASATWQIDQPTQGSGQETSDMLATEPILLSYDSHSCLAVLQDICSQWEGWEWRVDSPSCFSCDGEMLVTGVLRLVKKSANITSSVHNLGYGRSGGLNLIKVKYADDGNIPSRVYFYGGTQNVPSHYRNTRVCLPGFEKDESWLEFRSFKDALFPLGISNTTCEEVKVFDDIYPADKPFTLECDGVVATRTTYLGKTTYFLEIFMPKSKFFNIEEKWTNYTFPNRQLNQSADKTTYKDYFEWMKYVGVEDTYDSTEGEWTQRVRYLENYAASGSEKSKYKVSGESAAFTFQTGDLAGYPFSLSEMYIDPDDSTRYVILLEAVKIGGLDDGGEESYIPTTDIIARTGDTFIVDGVNMPASYTYYQGGGTSDYSAENQLWEAACDYMVSTSEKVDYEIEVAKDYVLRNGVRFSARDKVHFNDIHSESAVVEMRVTGVELDLCDGYRYRLTISTHGVTRPLIAQIITNR